MKRINIRAQHEIAGFILIVLIVSVIGIVFLTIAFSKDTQSHNSVEVSNLLESSMYYTTGCAMNYIPNYREMEDLIKECYKSGMSECYDGSDICHIVGTDLKKILDEGLDISERSVNKAYKLEIFYSSESEEVPDEHILGFSEGNFNNCSAIVGGGHAIPVSSFEFGTIKLELDVCKGSF